jgi:type III secretion protein Q
VKRARLPKLTREELGYRNAIAQAPDAMSVELAGSEWLLKLARTAPAPVAGANRIEIEWGGATFAADIPADTAQRFLRQMIPGAEAVELPENLRLAALEALRAELERGLTAKGSTPRPLRLKSLGLVNGAAAPGHRYGFTLSSQATGETIAGDIATDVAGLSNAAPLLKAAKRAAADPAQDWIDAIAMPLRLDAGHTVVDSKELAQAAVGDLILFDECFLSPEGEMSIIAAPGLGFRARVEGQKITVTQPLGAFMPENTNTPAGGNAADRIPVRLTFDLGERSLTVAELRELKPGYTFDLGRDVRRAVSIRAQGQLIGEGELVEIDGTLGVAITMLGAAGK